MPGKRGRPRTFFGDPAERSRRLSRDYYGRHREYRIKVNAIYCTLTKLAFPAEYRARTNRYRAKFRDKHNAWFRRWWSVNGDRYNAIRRARARRARQ